jgi:adenosylcobinamide-GDP ribazoletransferase
MSESGDARQSATATVSGIFTQIRLAGAFLTIIPLLDRRPRSAEVVAASFRWFPLVGFVLGAVLCAEDWAARAIIAPAPRAILIVLTLVIVTGAVHIDGLADAADALGAGRDRARALEIMRDGRIGTFGAISIFFLLILKISALAAVLETHRRTALYLAPGFARWAMVMVVQRMDYLREQGAGTALLQDNSRNLLIASIVTIAAAALAGSLLAVRAVLIALAMATILRAFYRRWLGGVTGDLIGAAGEIVETGLLLALSV